MNDLNGRIVPDTSTALPSVAHELEANAELNRLRTRLSTLEDENKILKAENAELRKKCMTNMECIQTADEYDLATMLLGIHGWGYTDAYQERGGSPFFDFDSPEDVIHWLKRTEWD